MTTEEKASLVGLCRIEIKRWKAASESNPNMRYMVNLMEIALSALTAEPVAVPDEYLEATQNDKGLFELSEDCMVRLAVALSRQQKGLVLKPGWKLVPIEPTKEMVEAGWAYYMTTKEPGSKGIWGSMIAAAPTP